jgi:hypothetical protein
MSLRRRLQPIVVQHGRVEEAGEQALVVGLPLHLIANRQPDRIRIDTVDSEALPRRFDEYLHALVAPILHETVLDPAAHLGERPVPGLMAPRELHDVPALGALHEPGTHLADALEREGCLCDIGRRLGFFRPALGEPGGGLWHMRSRP